MIGAKFENDDAEDAGFDAYNLVKKGKKARYAIFSVNDQGIVALNKVGDKDATHEDFVGEFGEEPLYAVYSFSYTTDEQPPRNVTKTFMVKWIPESLPAKMKFPVTSAFNSFKEMMSTQKSMEASDVSDLESANFVAKCN